MGVNGMKRFAHLLGAAAALAFAGQAMAAEYHFYLVPKNMNNPFFDQSRDGCKKAEAETGGAIKCTYIGPPEHGGGEEQIQILQDLLAKKVDGIAISPANAAAVARILERNRDSGVPVITFDADLLAKDRHLRIAYVGTNNYEIGVNLAKLVQKYKPQGGTICIQSGGAAADNHNQRMQGIRDTLSGQKSDSPPGVRLAGQGGWTEVDGCPLYTNDDFQVAVNQMEDILAKYPQLDAFVPTGGFPQFLPQAYRNVVSKYRDRIQKHELALVVADTLPVQLDLLREGLSLGQVGQRPFEMGYRAMYILRDIREGKDVPEINYTGLDVCLPENVDSCIGQ